MKNKALYKYINLLLRITIGIFAVYFIYSKLKDSFFIDFEQIRFETSSLSYVLFALILMILNWGIESIKWKYVIRKTEDISLMKAFKLTITGITLSILTPNRIGEIPFRALLLSKEKFKNLTLKTMVGSFSQVLITLIVGTVGLILNMERFQKNEYLFIFLPILIIVSLLLLLIYFKVNRVEKILNKINYFREKEIFMALSEFSFTELFNIWLMSFLRYLVFSLQYYLLLMAFDISFSSVNDILLIGVCFMFTSFIPTILISEIGVRGSVAIFVFGALSGLETQIVFASVVLWFINVGLPALVGLFNLKQIKIYKSV